MDPVTIALSVARTTKLAWDVGALLYDLIQDTKVVDIAVSSLASEITQLQHVCESVKGQLELLAKQYNNQSGLVSDLQKVEDTRIGNGIEAQLRECNRAMEKLGSAISGVRRERTNFFKQTLRQISLNMSKEQISESRTQIRAHIGNLQLSLQLVTLKATYLAPKLANQDLLAEMVKLRAAIELQGTIKLDSNLVQSARDLLSSSATLYTASVADGSVIGDAHALLDHKKTLDWLTRCDSLGLNDLGIGGSADDSQAPSTFSAPDDTRTIFTDETSTLGGVPLDTRNDQLSSTHGIVQEGELDVELDVQDEIALDAADTAFQFGSAAFENGEYKAADSDLQEALDLIKDLPIKLRHRYDAFELLFKLAICAFYAHNTDEAEIALESVVNKQSDSKAVALKLCLAGHLLAQVYINQGKLDVALATAENSYRVRRKLLGKSDSVCYESLALISKIFELLNNPARSRTFLRMIPLEAQESACATLRSLKPEKSTSLATTSLQSWQDWDAAARLAVRTLKGHLRSVNSVAFSGDGKLLASGSDDCTVRIWNAATGAAVRTLTDHSSSVHSVAFSGDGKLLASGALHKTVRIWDAATGAAVRTLNGHSSYVLSVAFSGDGKMLASGALDNTVRIWDAATGAAVRTLNGHSSYVTSVAFSGDGKLLASGSDDCRVRIWDAATGAAVCTLNGHPNLVNSVAFSCDGKLLASGSNDCTVRIWDAATGAAVRTLNGHSSSVSSVAFSGDSKLLASGSADYTVRIWDAATGAVVRTLNGHSSSVNSVAFSCDGKMLASGASDKTVRIWDAARGAAVRTTNG